MSTLLSLLIQVRKKLNSSSILGSPIAMLSKAEVQYLQGQKQLSKSYEYKIKSIIKKKLINLLDRDLPLLPTLFPNLLDLTKFSKINERYIDTNLTRFRKKRNMLLDRKKSVASERLRVQRDLPKRKSYI